MNLRTRLLFTGWLLLGTLAAQRTVIVDASNGPGTNHLTLAPAIAGLQADDCIVVRAGIYQGVQVVTQHSFTLQGEGNPLVQPVSNNNPAMSVALWGGQYQRVAIKGMRFESNFTGQWALAVSTSFNSWPSSTVNLEGVTAISTSALSDRLGLLVVSLGVTIQNCTLSPTQIIDSVATIAGTAITGHDAYVYQFSTQRAMTALDVLRSEVWIVDSTLRAGSSLGLYAEPASCIGFSDSSNTNASSVHVGGTCTLRSDAAPHPLWPMPSVFYNYTWFYALQPNVEYGPGVTMVPSPGGPAIGSYVSASTRLVPHQVASTASLGGTFTTTVRGGTNDIAISYASLSSYAQRIGSFEFFLDLATMAPLGASVVGGSGQTSFPLSIPALPSLRGLVIQVGSAVLPPSGVLEVVNPIAGQVQ